MPLRARNGETPLHSFSLSDAEWEALRDANAPHLRMTCCEARAIPKVSVLGTRFFAHWRREGCPVALESPEHLLAKVLVAQAAEAAGWTVTTEARGVSPEGEPWVADVLAENGPHRIAFEVQWASQTDEETRRRTDRYRRSGVRVAWFLRLRKRRTVYRYEVIDAQDTPVFGVRFSEETADQEPFTVARFQVSLSEFTRALLTREVVWGPAFPLVADVVSSRVHCFRCKRFVRLLAGLNLYDRRGWPVGAVDLYEPGILEAIHDSLTPSQLREAKLSPIRVRQSREGQSAYLSVACPACRVLQGQFYHEGMRFAEDPKVVARIRLPESVGVELPAPTWHLRGSPGEFAY